MQGLKPAKKKFEAQTADSKKRKAKPYEQKAFNENKPFLRNKK